MIKTAAYRPFDLKRGKCKCCSEFSNEIVIGDGRCVDCIQEDEFLDYYDNMYGNSHDDDEY